MCEVIDEEMDAALLYDCAGAEGKETLGYLPRFLTVGHRYGGRSPFCGCLLNITSLFPPSDCTEIFILSLGIHLTSNNPICELVLANQS